MNYKVVKNIPSNSKKMISHLLCRPKQTLYINTEGRTL